MKSAFCGFVLLSILNFTNVSFAQNANPSTPEQGSADLADAPFHNPALPIEEEG